jgi:hypothetical protein
VTPQKLQAVKRITATKLDLGCGDNKREGFFGIDVAKTAAADAVFDLTAFPWPIESGTVEALHCSHFFEHLTGAQRMAFMDECGRIMQVGAQLTIIVPYWSSMRAIQDPTHQWPPVCESSFLYFNRKWREDNKLGHYPIACDFDFGYGYALDNDVIVRAQDFQQFALRHYLQAANDLHVTLTKR